MVILKNLLENGLARDLNNSCVTGLGNILTLPTYHQPASLICVSHVKETLQTAVFCQMAGLVIAYGAMGFVLFMFFLILRHLSPNSPNAQISLRRHI